MSEAEAYITVEEAAGMLGVTIRQASRYQDRVRTQRVGNRILYHREDIRAQVAQRGRGAAARQAAQEYTRQQPPKPTPTNALIAYLQSTIARQEQLLLQFAHRIGELEAQLGVPEAERLSFPGQPVPPEKSPQDTS